jgi:hypothetical protein
MKYASDDEIDSGPVKKHKNYDMLVPPVSDVSGGDGDNGPD